MRWKKKEKQHGYSLRCANIYTHELNGSMNTWIFNAETHICIYRLPAAVLFSELSWTFLLSHCCCCCCHCYCCCVIFIIFYFPLNHTENHATTALSSLCVYDDEVDLLHLEPTACICFISFSAIKFHFIRNCVRAVRLLPCLPFYDWEIERCCFYFIFTKVIHILRNNVARSKRHEYSS